MKNLFQIVNQREMQKIKSDLHKKICISFFVGTLIALAFGLLFTPKSGKEMRKQAGDVCKKYRRKKDGELYVGNLNSDVFHLNTCVHLPNSDNRIVYKNRDEATASGKKPCAACNP